MASAGLGAVSAVSLDAILQAMADASVGDLGARVSVPPDAPVDDPLVTLAHALNILLGDLQTRERAASLHSERLRALVAQLPAGVVIAEAPTGRIVFSNPGAERIGGALAAQAGSFQEYGHLWPTYHEDGRPVADHEWPLARAIRRGEVVRDHLLQFRPAGRPPIWTSCAAAPIFDASGAVVGAIAIFEDVTERRESDAFRQSLLDGLADVGLGYIVSDGRRVLAVNAAFSRMMRTDPEALVGRDTTLLVTPEERAHGRARQDERLAQRAAQSFRCTFLRADGTTFPAEVAGRPLRGDPPRFVALVRDLTEEERARAEIEAARREVAHSEKLSALGSLVSGVAHEVRTPLTYLQNNLHILQRRLERAVATPDASEELRALVPELTTTLEAAERIGRLVEDLRRYTRLRAGAPQLVPLDVVVRQGVELFCATHRGGVEVRADLARTPDVLVDSLSAQQVVLNLLSNAIDASPRDGVVHVRVRPDEDGAGAWVEVEDAGPGIPSDTLARAFDPFFTTKPHGTGLGLSIVRRIVDESGGAIDVRTALGQGTTFRVRWPRRAESPASGGAGRHEGI